MRITSLGAWFCKSDGLYVQLLRYLIGGGCVFLIDLSMFYGLLLLAPQAHLAANGVAKVSGAISGFLLHKYFTYRWKQSIGTSVQLLRYLSLLCLNLVVATGLLFVGINFFDWPAINVKIGSDIVVIAISFMLSKTLVFRRN